MSAPEPYGPFAAARRADILAAFDVHLAAEDSLYESPDRLAVTRAAFASALVGARLPGEARMLLELALPDLTWARPGTPTAAARLLLATVELLTGDVRRAEDTASTALGEFRLLGQVAWEQRALDVKLRARLTQAVETGLDEGLLAECTAGADGLEAAGRHSEADELRLFVVSTVVRQNGRGTTDSSGVPGPMTNPIPDRGTHTIQGHMANAILKSVVANTTSSTPLDLSKVHRILDQVQGGSGCASSRLHAEALRRWASGDLTEALEVAQQGFSESLQDMSRLASAESEPEVRQQAEASAGHLVADTVPDAEHPPTIPLCEGQRLPRPLGMTGSSVATDTVPGWEGFTGRPFPTSASGGDVRDASTAKPLSDERWRVSRVAEEIAVLGLELAIGMGRAEKVLLWSERWRALVSGTEPVAERPEVLVQLVHDQDALHAVVAHHDRVSLHGLGSLSSITEAMVRIRYNLRRRNLRDTRPEGEEGLSPGLLRELAALDDVLIRPLELPTGAVSVVPTAALHSLPWSLLPSLRGQPVSVAPSAAMAVAGREVDGPVVALAGPDLAHADDEVAAVVGVHEKGEQVPATRDALLEALGRAGIVHIAAHGIFSGRRPMMSSILLDDGPLLVHEFFRLARVPPLVVLSACDAGMASAPADGAAFGLAGAFLDRGARTVVAGIVPVRDDEAARLMVEFHRLLARGQSPAQALARAAVATDVPGFACFGTG
ncbi:CHAT domain-containing protein [Herbidospora mongoliensis]|uniref:CHAT domain-containing protein n=1 Tax=Herbidospora mongoliensis TaxID=688067 RepID=UPI00082FDA1C|nr:CHAT domain-containing protein [Herbidospora mongoliensis]